jgi:hypothetical protein
MTDHTKIEIKLGKIPSLNKFYSSPHWTFRSREKTKWKEIITDQLDYDFQFEYCMAIKFTQDALVDAGMIADDNKKFIKAVRIEPATDIPKDTSVIQIEGKIINKLF